MKNNDEDAGRPKEHGFGAATPGAMSRLQKEEKTRACHEQEDAVVAWD